MTREQAILALLTIIPSFALGYLAYRRSLKVDAVSEKSGIASDTRAGVAQTLDTLSNLADQFQEDNRDLREELKQLAARFGMLLVERDALKREVARLRRKYGEDTDT